MNNVHVEADSDWFTVTFKRPNLQDQTFEERIHIPMLEIAGINEGLSEGINEGLNLLLGYIQRRPGMRTNALAKRMGKPVKTLERWIARLKKDKKIEFRGSKKAGGYWSLK